MRYQNPARLLANGAAGIRSQRHFACFSYRVGHRCASQVQYAARNTVLHCFDFRPLLIALTDKKELTAHFGCDFNSDCCQV